MSNFKRIKGEFRSDSSTKSARDEATSLKEERWIENERGERAKSP